MTRGERPGQGPLTFWPVQLRLPSRSRPDVFPTASPSPGSGWETAGAEDACLSPRTPPADDMACAPPALAGHSAIVSSSSRR